MVRSLLFLVLAGDAAIVWAQPTGLTARELFYEGQPTAAAVEKQPAPKATVSTKQTPSRATKIRPSGAVATNPSGSPKAAGNSGSGASVATASNVGASSATTGGIVPVALRLGLRYNLLLVDDIKTGRTHEVDPDGKFKAGDCFQVRLRPSRSGRMYVFNQGSSGNFNALLPSVLALDEPNDVTANQEITIARDHCFQLDDRKGVDKLIIMITDRPEDLRELNKPIPGKPTETQLALRVKSVFEDQAARLISRDMSIQKIGSSPDDPPNSVYVVKTAAATSDRLTIEIQLRHE